MRLRTLRLTKDQAKALVDSQPYDMRSPGLLVGAAVSLMLFGAGGVIFGAALGAIVGRFWYAAKRPISENPGLDIYELSHSGVFVPLWVKVAILVYLYGIISYTASLFLPNNVWNVFALQWWGEIPGHDYINGDVISLPWLYHYVTLSVAASLFFLFPVIREYNFFLKKGAVCEKIVISPLLYQSDRSIELFGKIVAVAIFGALCFIGVYKIPAAVASVGDLFLGLPSVFVGRDGTQSGLEFLVGRSDVILMVSFSPIMFVNSLVNFRSHLKTYVMLPRY